MINENPYLILDIVENVDFSYVDKIASDLEFEIVNINRIKYGVKYTLLKNFENGNTCLLYEKLLTAVSKFLHVDLEYIENAIIEMKVENEIEVETRKNNEEYVYLARINQIENMVANKIKSMLNENEKRVDISDRIKVIEKKLELTLTDMQRKAIEIGYNNNISVITGGPGTGKTTIIQCLMKLFLDDEKNVSLCAPTGRAAKRITEVTGYEAKTIHRLLDLTKIEERIDKLQIKVEQLKTDVVILDEASMLDAELWDIILTNSSDCKFILVGDMYQLPAVGANADVFNKYRVVELTGVVRQKDPTFLNAIAIAKEGVLQKTILDLPDSPCIKYKTLADREELIEYFTNFNSSTDKVLCYTNEAAVYYSHCIRQTQGKTDDLYAGDLVTSRSFISQCGETIHIEDVLRIESISEPRIISFYGYQLSIRDVTFKHKMKKYMVAASWQEFATLLKMISKDKKWRAYFYFKDTILDLRSVEACTVHCSQGSTYERVFIDYNDLMKCKAHSIKSRLYYVALSRAKHEVIIFKE